MCSLLAGNGFPLRGQAPTLRLEFERVWSDHAITLAVGVARRRLSHARHHAPAGGGARLAVLGARNALTSAPNWGSTDSVFRAGSKE